jgi:IclR family KDG regulon transcriptional repressor
MSTRLVPALVRGLDILKLLGHEPGLTPPAIATQLGLPRTTVHELLKTLESQGFVTMSDGTGYRIGMPLFELGKSYERGLDLVGLGKRSAEAVAAECGETVQIAVLDHTDVIYIVQVNSTHKVQLVSSVGGRLPAHLTAVGKINLAFQPPEVVSERYPPGQALATLTPASLATTEALLETLDQIRLDGVAWDECESNPDVCCVAAPIWDAKGAVAAGMSISVPVHRWNAAAAAHLRTLVVAGADRVSTDLGHRVG